jgi:hypothetical protein
MINTLIALPYKLARAPLAVVDNTLADRLPETSMPRTTLGLVIGATDKFAGSLLGDEELGRRGAERIERSETLREAHRLEHEADVRRAQAEKVATDSMEVADVVEAREKREAKDAARKSAADKKRAADTKAQQRTATIEKRKQAAASGAEAKRKSAQRQAKAKFDEAREAEKKAATARSDAERLEDLAAVKKQERKDS